MKSEGLGLVVGLGLPLGDPNCFALCSPFDLCFKAFVHVQNLKLKVKQAMTSVGLGPHHLKFNFYQLRVQ